MIRTFFYRFIYFPPVNKIVRRLNRLLLPLVPGVMTPVSGEISFRLHSGKRIFLLTNQTDYVAKLIYYKGVYSYEYVDLFERLIKRCSGFIDIGSNAGLYSLVAAVEGGQEIKVIAFDPSAASSFFVPRNITRNNCREIITYFNCALSDVSGDLTFYEVTNPKYPFEKHNLGGASSLVTPPEEYLENRVKVFRLDDFISEHDLDDQQIDLIKIDAEGAEPLIMAGMGKLIKKWKPIIICEILFGTVETAIDREISKYNYQIYLHSAEGLSEVSGVTRDQDNDIRNCFLVPVEKQDWITEFTVNNREMSPQ